MRIQLQTFTSDDFERLIQWIDTPETLRLWGGARFTYPLDEAQLVAYIADASGDHLRRYVYRAVTADLGEVVGHVELCSFDQEPGAATVGRVLVSPMHRGRGLCNEIVRGVLHIAFSQLGLRKLNLQVHAINARAIHCYEKAGFVHDGPMREDRDVLWMHRDAEHWPSL